MLTRKEVDNLFHKFSHPLVKSALTKHQKKAALHIAKTLWLSLVKGLDTEQNVYIILNEIFNNNHQSNIATGSLYFFRMKPALTEEEHQALLEYYEIDDNFNALENWIK